MVDKERQQQILDYIRMSGRADVNSLAKIFFVSAASVRRDLTELQNLGLVRRTHGGVLYNVSTGERSISVRQTENIAGKEAAVAVALDRLPDFESVFFDNSSTCYLLAQKLDLGKKTVVTNGLRLAAELARRGAKVIMLGGEVTDSADQVSGSITTEAIGRYRFDAAFVSCAAVDGSSAYERSFDTAVLKRTAVKRAASKCLIFDAAKLDRDAPYSATELAEFDMIATDAPDARLTALRDGGCTVYNKMSK